MKLRDLPSAEKRRAFLEKEAGVDLAGLGNFGFDENTVSSKNCENLIGSVHVPLGVAGPLRLTAKNNQSTTHYVPLATTEGALVASTSRGCKAISLSGGCYAYAYRAGTTRAPVFYIPSWKKNEEFSTWIQKNISTIKKIASSTSKHLQLIDIEEVCTVPYVFLRMRFDTADAMGMNMVTIASEAIVSFIENEMDIRCISLSGNVDVDKKPSWRNSISRRGWVSGAEVVLTESVLKKTLKTTAESLYEVWVSKCMIGSAVSGSIGFNAHSANVLAALFIATGQDVAHVAECSASNTICEKRGENLFISIQLPDLMVGTIGGGTGLKLQKKCLEILACLGSGKVEKLARIVAGTVLAGEISLLASLSEGSLARAHKLLGR